MFVGSKVNSTRYEVTIPANTTHNSRSATFRWVQEETSDQQSRKITQAAADNDYDFRISLVSGGPYYSSVEVDYPAGGSTDAPTYTFYLYSRKNGALFSNSVAKVESNANWITITAQDRPAFTVAINSDSASRDGIITLTQKESGNTCQIKVHQAGASVEEWRYTLVVTPTVVNFSSSGGNQSVTVESYRELYVNGVYQSGSKEFVNWSSSEYIAWASTVDNQTSLGTYKGTCTITAIANSTTSDRSGEVLITQSDMSGTNSTVRVTQAAKVEDVYVFTWSDGSVTDVSTGPFKANEGGFTIGPPKMPAISTKNGATHGYSVTSKPSWLEVRLGDTIVVDLTNNTSTSSRSGSIVLTQNNSGKTLTITLSQTGYAYEFQWVNGGVVEGTDVVSYTLTVAPGYVFNSSSEINGLVSTRSVDNWATNAEPVDFTVIDNSENSWLTVTSNAYGGSDNPGLYSVFFSGTVPQTPGTTYTVQFLQHESAKVCLFKIVVSDYQFVFADNNSTTMTKSIDSRGQVVMGEWHVNDRDLFLLSYNGSTYVDWEWSSDSSWVYVFDDGEYFNIEADRNDGSARTGVLTFTQRESGKKCTLTVSQAGTTQVMDIQITNHTGAMFYLDMNGGTPDYTNATCIPGGSLRQNGGLSFDGVIKISYDHASGDYMEVIFYDNSGNRLPIDYYNYDFNNNQDPDNSIVCTVGSSSLYLTFNKNTSVAPGRVYGTLDCNFAPNYGVAHIEILGYY